MKAWPGWLLGTLWVVLLGLALISALFFVFLPVGPLPWSLAALPLLISTWAWMRRSASSADRILLGVLVALCAFLGLCYGLVLLDNRWMAEQVAQGRGFGFAMYFPILASITALVLVARRLLRKPATA